MSDLREAIRDAIPNLGLEIAEYEAIADAVLVVVEAYLREHDAQIIKRIEALRLRGDDGSLYVLEVLLGSDE